MTAHRRMTAVALAIRLYEIDHGSRPEQLSQLEPDYLSSIPLDPFSETSHPFKYKPHARNPALYSVGPDGKDDGYALLNDDNYGSFKNRLDIPFLLDGMP